MEPSKYRIRTKALRRIRTLRLLVLLHSILATGCCLFLVTRAAGQDTSSPTVPATTESQSPNDPAQQPAAPVSTEAEPKQKSKKTDTKKDEKKGAFVIAPLPMVSPAIGSGIVP